MHAAAEIAACRSKAQACRIALMHSGLTQEDVAARLPCSNGYLSLLLSGKRRWVDETQQRFEQITRSFAPAQWDARRRGLVLYADPVEIRRAQLTEELAQLNTRAA